MLMQRTQPHNSAFSSKPNMSLAINGMQHQQHHINQLMNTAAAGTGIVGDVDALLTPIQKSSTPTRFETRTERNLWRTEEIMQMLEYMQKTNALSLLNDKTVKSENVFRNVEELMHKSGYRKKSHAQIWTKWKFLKSTYTTTKRNGTMPQIPPQVYQELHKMLGSGSSDLDSTATSLDGDNSNSSRLVIAGVEGSYANGVSTGRKSTADDDEENGLAHPIFGFRLGVVKQEPADNGYEVITNNGVTTEQDTLDEHNANSTCSSLGYTQFQTEIKQEAEELLETPSPPQHVKKSPKQSKAEILAQRRAIRINPVPIAPKPSLISISSVPNAQSVVNKPVAAGMNGQMPPLRIAPFAKVSSGNANAMQPPAAARPPPPLSMHPPVRTIRLTNTGNNSIAANLLQRKTLAKVSLATPTPSSPQAMLSPIRLPKDITVQTRASAADSAPANMQQRIKFTPERKSYTLKSELVVPDLELSPPAPLFRQHQQQQYSIYQEGPSTSQRAANAATAAILAKKRKRRLDIPWNQTVPNVKIPRFSPKPASNITTRDYYSNNNDDGSDYGNDYDDNSAQQQQRQQQSSPKSFKPSPKEQEFFDSALKDLGTSLRQMQREMLNEFFKNQMELARKEHEFQMQQDLLIMKAFAEQTQKLMSSAKDLLGLDLNDKANSNKAAVNKCKKSLKSDLGIKDQEMLRKAAHAAMSAVANAAQLEQEDNNDHESEEEDNSDSQDDDEQLDYDEVAYQNALQDVCNGNPNESLNELNESSRTMLEMQGEEEENGYEDDDDDESEHDDDDGEEEEDHNEQQQQQSADINDMEDDDGEQEGDIADPIQLVTSELVED